MDEERTMFMQNTMPQQNFGVPTGAPQTPVKPPKKSKKVLLICILSLVVVAAAAVAFVLLKGSKDTDQISVWARKTEDGTAYIPLYNGKAITINEEVKQAFLTPDRKHVIVLLEDGTLYVTDKKLSEKHTIANNCMSFGQYRDDGFFYTDEEAVEYKVLYSDYSPVYIGDDLLHTRVAKNNTSLLYATTDGDIYKMASHETEGTKVGTYDDEISLETISDDGQLSLWVLEDEDNETGTIILNEGDEQTTLAEIDDGYTYATFTKDQKALFITNTDSKEMWVKKANKEPMTIKLAAPPYYNSVIYTSKGALADENAFGMDDFYISVADGSGFTNLYQISMDGERECVLSGYYYYLIANGKILYSKEGDLYYADLHGSEVRNENRLANDVHSCRLSDDGKYVFYCKGYDDGVSNLYCYRDGDGKPVRVASDVTFIYPRPSIDGSTVFFYKDEEDIGDAASSYGTLMKWRYGDDKPEQIATEVLPYSLLSGLLYGELDPSSFMYLKYTSVDEDENIYANWMYYNGRTSKTVATDVIY